ncbi:MAG: tRNA (adenosine(37)-N6)-threonylcarbamoyltransferase complex ATPase subunit type 1 TsaE [Candidatus Dormibacteraceae bacterium]
MSSRELICGSPEETEAAAERLAAHLRQGELLLLAGPLGAGKTTFVRGLARGLGSTAPVASPTFQLVRIYPGRMPLAHIDLYRLVASIELADLGLEELLEDGVAAVEWGDRLPHAIEDGAGRVVIEPLGGDRRRIEIHGGPPQWCW